jgi:hypothetical protein
MLYEELDGLSYTTCKLPFDEVQLFHMQVENMSSKLQVLDDVES